MSRPCKMTEQMIVQLTREFYDSLVHADLPDGKVKYEKLLSWGAEKSHANLMFTPIAFAKQLALVQHNQKEIGWHGFVRRDDDDPYTFIVDDIAVYPQRVTGASINPDQIEYQKWMDGLDDEHFNKCRFFGHSHVMMQTFASSTDSAYQSDILSQIDDTMFYCFIIMNQKGEHWAKIYDKKNNVVFENSDISIGIASSDVDLDAFITDSDKKVVSDTVVQYKAPVVPYVGNSYYDQYAAKYKDGYHDSPKQATTNGQKSSYAPGRGWFDANGAFHAYSWNEDED